MVYDVELYLCHHTVNVLQTNNKYCIEKLIHI